MRRKPEILAPAGSIQGLKAVIAAGCDAVYIGGSRFGARAYAKNPETSELLEAIAYCHLHHVKLYLTVNTLLKEKEIENGLFAWLQPYYEAGIDAVIVQDTGVLHFLKKHFPSLPVHISTQMTLTQAKEMEWLREYHVSRIVPSRELSLSELSRMRKDTNLELEVFVHGALCYCYSGQCLFSSMLGKRSGNRGRCAQPCRMPYYIDGKSSPDGDYLLSLKELCNLSYLPELLETGVDSFKIEGRMKREEYAAFVTAIFRKYTDRYFTMGREGYREWQTAHAEEWKEDLRCLSELYNREGFTQGYLEGIGRKDSRKEQGRDGRMLARQRPRHGGVYIGKVLSVHANEAVYQAEKKLSAQDVVEFRDRQQNVLYEYTIKQDIPAGQTVTARYQKGSRILPGDTVYRTKDAVLLDRIRKNWIDRKKQLPITGRLQARGRQPLVLCVARDGVSVTCTGAVCALAKNKPVDTDFVKKVIQQTGESLFYFEELEIILEEGLFLPAGVLKKLRRQALDELAQKITESFFRTDTVPQDNRKLEGGTGTESIRSADRFSKKYTEACGTFLASVTEWEQLEAVLQADRVWGVYVQTGRFSPQEIKAAFQRIKEAQKKAYLGFPAVFRAETWDAFAKEYQREDSFLKYSWEGYLVKNMESISFLRQVIGETGEKIRLDHNMYVMNREARRFWKEQGISHMTLPLEATEKEWEELLDSPLPEILVYGRIPLMVSAQCILANTRTCEVRKHKNAGALFFSDRRKNRFAALPFCQYCYNSIYQEEPVFLLREIRKNEKLCHAAQRYSFTTENGREVTQILRGKVAGKTQTGHFNRGVE